MNNESIDQPVDQAPKPKRPQNAYKRFNAASIEQETLDTLVNFFNVLANGNRLRILGLLANEERSVEELATLLGVKEPTVSQHLQALKWLGLVRVEAEGNSRIYTFDPNGLPLMVREVFARDKMAGLVDGEGEAWKHKVLATYLEGEQLKKIPETRRKRQVVLDWLANKFELGREYPEAELNTIIKRHHEDTATLRREMIGTKLMQRANGIYWRLTPEQRAALLTQETD